MSESAQHLQLVNLIIDEVVGMVGEANRCFIMSDAADGYIPIGLKDTVQDITVLSMSMRGDYTR